jgi:VWFA-related protein
MHSLRLRACFGIASLIFIFRSNGIAQAQQAPTISTKVNLVSVLATVHGKDGKAIKNLAQDDFVLLEDGVSQKIDYFSEEANLPLTVGLVVDTSRSQREVLDQERRANSTFLDQVLRERADRAFVVQFDTGVKTLQALDAPQ